MADSVTDCVVVGGGLAGFAAALTAAEAGAQVTLIEKLAEFGGSSAICGGSFAFAGTDLQRASGIEDSSDLLFKDLREVGENENDERVVRAYVTHQHATYEWLRRQGVPFAPVIMASSGQSVPRSHQVDPADMMRLLARRAADNPLITLLRSTRVRRLVRSESGRVEAVQAENSGGTFTLTARRGIVLASGGFNQDAELVHRFAPICDNAVFVGGKGNTGDGLRMAWRLGADFRDVSFIKGTFGKHPIDETNDHSCLAVYKGAIAVNEAGRRYVDESISYKLLGDACLRQANGVTYQIFDQDVFDLGDNRLPIMDFERRFEHGLIVKADTLEQLARLLELPVDAVVATVAEYNGFVDAGHDPQFNRKNLVHHHGELRRIERAPFYACPSTAAVYGTYCGLCVDADMRVIDVFGEPIEGLYAAGEIVGGLHGAAYMTGSSLGKSGIFGRIAGRSAAAASER